MSRHQHLPLYDALYRYTKELYTLKGRMTKSLKYDLGEALCESALRALKLVVFANGSEKKDAPLRDLALEVEAQWVYIRLAHDLKAVTLGQYKLLGERLTEINKQISAWRKWYKEEIRKLELLEDQKNNKKAVKERATRIT